MQEAFGSLSLEFGRALVADAAVRPLARYDQLELDLACACLAQHGLVKAYCTAVGNKADASAIRRNCTRVAAARVLAAAIAAESEQFSASSQ